jgi:hypothetical protein
VACYEPSNAPVVSRPFLVVPSFTQTLENEGRRREHAASIAEGSHRHRCSEDEGKGITVLLTSLTHGGDAPEETR